MLSFKVMCKWFRSLSGRYSYLPLLLLVSMVSLSSCSQISPLKFLTGGGPNVAANIQAGKTNSQTVGKTQNTDQKARTGDNSKVIQSNDDTKVKTETVEKIIVNEIDPKLVAVLLFLFILWSYFLYRLPSPDQIWKKK